MNKQHLSSNFFNCNKTYASVYDVVFITTKDIYTPNKIDFDVTVAIYIYMVYPIDIPWYYV